MCKLIHGNSFNVLNGFKKVDAIITDPPYNFNEDQMKELHSMFVQCCDGPIIIFCPPENQWCGLTKPDQYCFWVKPISTKNTSKSYSRFVEMILIWNNGGAWNADRHWSQYTNIFNDIVDSTSSHPYRKPVSMLERLILNHTLSGHTILDPFMGIGSTGEACKRNGRNFVGIELDVVYYDLAVRNLNAKN